MKVASLLLNAAEQLGGACQSCTGQGLEQVLEGNGRLLCIL